MPRVLVSEILCGGGWVEPGRFGDWAPALLGEAWAMLDAVTADFAAIPGVSTVALLADQIDRTLDPRVETVRVPPGQEPEVFCQTARRVDYALVIAPEFDALLFDRCTWAEQAGAALLGPTPEAVRLTSDKLALARHWQAAGVPTPPTVLAPEPPSFSPPWVVKPRFGAGSHGVQIEQAGITVRDLNASIVQPLLPGRPASIAFLIGPRQTISLAPCWQHLDDSLHYLGGATPIPEPFITRALEIAQRAIASVSGLQGYVGVDLILGERDWAIEINPRLTTSYIGLRQLCENNLARALLDVVWGSEVELRWRERPVKFTVA